MSIHRVQLDLNIDDEALADHLAEADGERPPYSADLNDWNADDVARAAELDIIDLGDCAFTYIGKVG
jgi:hypothetical protein